MRGFFCACRLSLAIATLLSQSYLPSRRKTMNEDQKKAAAEAQEHIRRGAHQQQTFAHLAQVAKNYPQHGQPNQK